MLSLSMESKFKAEHFGYSGAGKEVWWLLMVMVHDWVGWHLWIIHGCCSLDNRGYMS